ncbi:hypothetical protein FS837_010314 [Tulasnella sp. UAMH 9824]|nr:hypothetical protein FS837_010314 [Tulasnella sp. UAMH 9824]
MKLAIALFALALVHGGGTVPAGVTTALPSSSGYSSLPTASIISGTFDGGMKRFDRAGTAGLCEAQVERTESDAVFILQSGATIQNVIIGPHQAMVAITLKQTGSGDVSYILGGGAFHTEDKIVQHNGYGTVMIKNFYANDFGRLYRSCGTCSGSYPRHVYVDSVALINGTFGVAVNENWGDTATLTNVCTNGKPSATNVCCRYTGVSSGASMSIGWYDYPFIPALSPATHGFLPLPTHSGPSGSACNYSTSSITTC